MQNLDMTTKELVKTFVYDDINSNRQVQKQNVVNGRTVIELGTRPATVFVGNLYKVFDLNVKSFKYLLMVGVARQNVNWNKPINKEQAEELAKLSEQEKASKNIEEFLNELKKELPEDTKYSIKKDKSAIYVEINSPNLGFLIGYRGETLYAFQSILSAIAGKEIDKKVRVILDIEGYKAKREKTLEELAEKVAKTVIKTRKSIKLEPMQAYERKIIHSKLQQNPKVKTESIGEEPNRRIVISLKK